MSLYIYKIHKAGDPNYYIGSTKDVKVRSRLHKSDVKKECPNVHEYIRLHGGWDSWTMTIVGKCDETRDGEIKLIRELQPTLNKNKYKYTNKADYYKARYQEKKEHINTLSKAWYHANKDKLQEKFNCACGGKYTFNHKVSHCRTNRHKDYLESLKDDPL